VPGL
jgi:hypothetical protein